MESFLLFFFFFLLPPPLASSRASRAKLAQSAAEVGDGRSEPGLPCIDE